MHGLPPLDGAGFMRGRKASTTAMGGVRHSPSVAPGPPESSAMNSKEWVGEGERTPPIHPNSANFRGRDGAERDTVGDVSLGRSPCAERRDRRCPHHARKPPNPPPASITSQFPQHGGASADQDGRRRYNAVRIPAQIQLMTHRRKTRHARLHPDSQPPPPE